MLNYIWAGLIVSSFVFALGYDIRDISADRYRNGRPLPVSLSFPTGYDSVARRVPIEICSSVTARSLQEPPQAPAPGV